MPTQDDDAFLNPAQSSFQLPLEFIGVALQRLCYLNFLAVVHMRLTQRGKRLAKVVKGMGESRIELLIALIRVRLQQPAQVVVSGKLSDFGG